jgi:hypothetical protein
MRAAVIRSLHPSSLILHPSSLIPHPFAATGSSKVDHRARNPASGIRCERYPERSRGRIWPVVRGVARVPRFADIDLRPAEPAIDLRHFEGPRRVGTRTKRVIPKGYTHDCSGDWSSRGIHHPAANFVAPLSTGEKREQCRAAEPSAKKDNARGASRGRGHHISLVGLRG